MLKELLEHKDGSVSANVFPDRPTNRLTIVESVYHRTDNGDPEATESKFSLGLKTDEQVYIRKTTASIKWEELDCGWIKECSFIIIRSEAGKDIQVQLDDKQKAKEAKKIIEIAYVNRANRTLHKPWLVLPGTSIRMTPSCLENLSIRARYGGIKYKAYIFPS